MELTKEERAVCLKLAEAWNAFICLPIEHPADLKEFQFIIHQAQDKVLGRVGRRIINRKDVSDVG